MNNSFSLARFGAYTKAEAHIHLKKALSLVGLYILLAALYFMFPIVMNMKMQLLPMANLLTSVAVFGMFLVTSGAFKVFQKPGGGTFAMQMPVATCEKFTLRVITHLIILPAIVFLVPRMTCDVIHSIYQVPIHYRLTTYAGFWEMVAILMVPQTAFFYGAVLFRKSNFLKMAGCGLIVWLLIQCFWKLGDTVYDFNKYALAFSTFINNYGYYVSGVLTLGFVVLAWAKFRKLQILK